MPTNSLPESPLLESPLLETSPPDSNGTIVDRLNRSVRDAITKFLDGGGVVEVGDRGTYTASEGAAVGLSELTGPGLLLFWQSLSPSTRSAVLAANPGLADKLVDAEARSLHPNSTRSAASSMTIVTLICRRCSPTRTQSSRNWRPWPLLERSGPRSLCGSLTARRCSFHLRSSAPARLVSSPSLPTANTEATPAPLQ